jgi:hypothetical protein
MHSEIAAYVQSIEHRLSQICACIEGLTADQLNYRPAPGDANSAYALAAHAVGNARAWILGIACGQEYHRDRPGEFASSGDDAALLIADARLASKGIAAALASIDTARLDVRLVPDRELWGEGEPREVSVREAIVQVIEHASLHLGHLQLTRDLALARA